MNTKRLALVLVVILLLGAVAAASASSPLSVRVTVDKEHVRVGDTVRVSWTLSGGAPPYSSWIEWNNIWTHDTDYEVNTGPQKSKGTCSFKVKPGMLPRFTFDVWLFDQKYHDNPKKVSSQSLGINIINLDGWDSDGTTKITLDKNFMHAGETITATVDRSFAISQNSYYGFYYQWLTVDARGNESLTETVEVPYGQHRTVLRFTPREGVGGQLRVYAHEPKFPDDFSTVLYRSSAFTILQGTQGGTSQNPMPARQVAARIGTPASLKQDMATRSGPDIHYTEELGVMPRNTEITLIETVTTGVPWGLVEFYREGVKVRAYTGMKRISAHGPVAQGTLDYYEVVLSQNTEVYYGPGYNYGRRSDTVRAGTTLRVFGAENGFTICDYKSRDGWVRAYFPVI